MRSEDGPRALDVHHEVCHLPQRGVVKGQRLGHIDLALSRQGLPEGDRAEAIETHVHEAFVQVDLVNLSQGLERHVPHHLHRLIHGHSLLHNSQRHLLRRGRPLLRRLRLRRRATDLLDLADRDLRLLHALLVPKGLEEVVGFLGLEAATVGVPVQDKALPQHQDGHGFALPIPCLLEEVSGLCRGLHRRATTPGHGMALGHRVRGDARHLLVPHLPRQRRGLPGRAHRLGLMLGDVQDGVLIPHLLGALDDGVQGCLRHEVQHLHLRLDVPRRAGQRQRLVGALHRLHLAGVGDEEGRARLHGIGLGALVAGLLVERLGAAAGPQRLIPVALALADLPHHAPAHPLALLVPELLKYRLRFLRQAQGALEVADGMVDLGFHQHGVGLLAPPPQVFAQAPDLLRHLQRRPRVPLVHENLDGRLQHCAAMRRLSDVVQHRGAVRHRAQRIIQPLLPHVDLGGVVQHGGLPPLVLELAAKAQAPLRALEGL
mmetsp:Transcript_93609/g.222544  ORF Transcript_93609/g.222544 Transcript_93609/m.222544 type:complete len:488 (+) Transcript_93609:43-1506(+)